jgi:parallel beta-helix repeat protein
VTTDTKLGGGDPVVSKGLDDVCPVGDALGVAAGVTLDLGGRHLRGTFAEAFDGNIYCGIVILGAGATVQNGRISRFGPRFPPHAVFLGLGLGVCAAGVDGLTIRDLELSDVPGGIAVFGGSGHLIEENEVRLNRFQGGSGIHLDSVASSKVSQNDLVGSGRPATGIVVVDSTGVDLVENSVRSVGAGFLVTESSGVIEDNEASGNRGFGFSIVGDSNSIRRNIGSNNGDHGLNVSGNGNQVTENVISENLAEGLGVAGSGNTITGNQVTRNSIRGLFAEGGGNIDGGGNVGTGNVLPLPLFDSLQCQIDGVACAP